MTVKSRRLAVWLVNLVATLVAQGLWAQAQTPEVPPQQFTPQEQAFIVSLGPWPPTAVKDPSNRYSQQPDAIELGRQLFFDRRLSQQQLLSCADCHHPNKAFQDNIPLNRGFEALHRNTTSLLNLANRPWYGWGGEHDSLWSQSIRPMLSVAEMRTDLSALKQTLSQDEYFKCAFKQVTDYSIDQLDNDAFLISIGKLLASYQETITSGKTRFDVFRDQMIEAQIGISPMPALTLTSQEQAGLKLFVGEGRCVFCHAGPHLSNGEFGDIGVPFFIPDGVDKGRYNGIKQLQNDRFNLLGKYNDDASKSNAQRTLHLQLLHRNWGEFKVPSLRNIGQTAPYMHNGSVESLTDVVEFYSDLNEERLHSDGEKILRPLHLSIDQKNSLEAFLQSLTGPVKVRTAQPERFEHCQLSN